MVSKTIDVQENYTYMYSVYYNKYIIICVRLTIIGNTTKLRNILGDIFYQLNFYESEN